MPYYRVAGEVPSKRHTQFRQVDGTLFREELMGAEGFSADSSLLYHRGDPAAILDSQVWELPDQQLTPNHPLRPRHLRLPELAATDPSGADAVSGRRLVLGNHDLRISYVVAGAPSPLYRNAIGDECVFVEAGTAVLTTVFGSFEVGRGDYLVIPRGTTHQWLPTGAQPMRLYAIEAGSHIGPPRRYLSARGQFLEHAPYCERDLRMPDGPSQIWQTDVEVYVKHRGPTGVLGSILTHATHPFDVVGWDGCLYPYAFNVADFEPITGRIHQPPPVHQVFEGTKFVVCNFVPRKVDYHPLAVPVPYHHSNVDSDEVMFYVAGNYRARSGSGVAAGSVSLHPGGHTHGPQPGSAERSLGAERFDELAIMVDTFAPLALGEGALACEDPAYAGTWANNGPRIRP
ncbi:MAG: homogentisate 1,2-dioxygenase [Sporichthyaceae bacterium]